MEFAFYICGLIAILATLRVSFSSKIHDIIGAIII